MRIRSKLMCAVASVFLLGGAARAELLGLELIDFPDIASRFIDVSYDSAGDTLSVDGFALLFDDDGNGPSEDISDGSFNISASIDENGNPTAGTLTIGGNVLGFGPVLLTGVLTDFGFQDGGGPLFEFLFTITGGDLADPFYGGVGTTVGVILSGTGFGGDWGKDFDNLNGGVPGTGSAVSDVGLIPAPAALGLLALAGLAGRRRRREA